MTHVGPLRRVATTLDCAWQAGRDAWEVIGRRNAAAGEVDGDEATEPTGEEFEVLPLGCLDLPDDGEEVAGGVLSVRGWVRHDLGVDRVEVRLGDAPPQRCRLLAEPRPDLADLVDDPAVAMAGWEALVAVPLGAPREEELVAEAVGPEVREVLGRRTVRLLGPEGVPAEDPHRMAVLAARANARAARNRARTDGVHILVATHHLGLGGGQLYLHEVLRHMLAAEDVSCTVLSSVDGVLREELEEWGARVHVTGPVPVSGPDYEARMLELAALVDGTGVNIVLANTTGSFWGVDLGGRLGVPAVWAIHESFRVDEFVQVAYGVPVPDAHVVARLRAALAGAAAVVFEADATRRLYEPDLPAGRSVRIDYGIDLDRIDRYRREHDRSAVRRHLGVTPGERLLVSIGTYEPRKAQAALAVAFARAAAEHPDARLALVGDTGSHFAVGVRDLVERLDLDHRIRLLPVTPDIDAWYLAADGFVVASDIESLPRSMLEAMAYGVPVIATSIFGVPEVIVDGQNGLLFEPLDLASLTATLRRFLALGPAEREAIGALGRQHAETVRPAKYYADAYRRLCEVLVADPRALPGEALRAP